jgi:hypothetical protein
MRLPNVVLMLAAVTLASLAGCGMPHLLYGKRVAGQVVDMDTGQPIAGAHVALLWEAGINPSGFTGHNSRDICYHAAATTTDTEGHFEIPAWSKWKTYNIENVDPMVLVYAPKYEPTQHSLQPEGPSSAPSEHPNERYRLRKFSGTAESRLDMLFLGLANQSCSYGGGSQKSLYPMLKAIHTEVRRIGTPKEVYGFALEAAYAALAPDPNGPAQDAKLRAFIEENLQ